MTVQEVLEYLAEQQREKNRSLRAILDGGLIRTTTYGMIPPPPAEIQPCPHELVGDAEIIEKMIECRSESLQVFLERLRKKGLEIIRRKP